MSNKVKAKKRLAKRKIKAKTKYVQRSICRSADGLMQVLIKL